MIRYVPVLLMLAALIAAGPAAAQEEHHHDHSDHHDHHHEGPPPRPECPVGETALRCATTLTPTFAPGGALLAVWTAGGRVMVARSGGGSDTLGAAVAVNTAPDPLDDTGESRAAIAADAKGRVVVAYAVRKPGPDYLATLMIAHSADGGRTFSPPETVASDDTGQRFPVLAGDGKGRVVLVWLDKRGVVAAKKAGQEYAGTDVAVTESVDGGATFRRERLVVEHSCECCRLALALDPAGRPVLLWRHIFPVNIRDHAVMVLGKGPPVMHRVSMDDWKIDGCPHHGGAVAVDSSGVIHVSWYSGGGARRGLFEARSANGGQTFSAPRQVGNPARQPGHPQLLAAGRTLWLAWTEFDGQRTHLMVQHSGDGGRSWSAPAVAADTADAADQPLLVGDGHRAMLSWLTRNEGWRQMALAGGEK